MKFVTSSIGATLIAIVGLRSRQTSRPRSREWREASRKPAGRNPGVRSANHKISLVDPQGGEVMTFDVNTPEGRSQSPRVKSGDKLTIVETETLVVSVTPKAWASIAGAICRRFVVGSRWPKGMVPRPIETFKSPMQKSFRADSIGG